MPFINTGIHGDGDLYSADLQALNYAANQEAHMHRISVRLTYTAAVIPGGGEVFKIYDIRLRVAEDRQGSFTHEAFIDATTPSQRIAVKLSHSGSEFIVSHIQLIAQRKKHQPIG
jgi:hypothetical protein